MNLTCSCYNSTASPILGVLKQAKVRSLSILRHSLEVMVAVQLLGRASPSFGSAQLVRNCQTKRELLVKCGADTDSPKRAQ